MKNIIILLLIILPLASVAQDEILLTIDSSRNITLDEFKRIYLKNNSKTDDALTQQAVEDYLELFVNFKLKVYEAERLNLDKRASFIAELKKYRDQLAEPYLVDQSTSDKLYKEAYDRMFKAVRASHILLRLDQNAKPADTLAVYNKALELKQKIEEGALFSDVAKKYSEDPSAKQNFGQLGYFSAMRMVYPFESAAFNTPVGQVSNPIRTQFGYHIIQVSDKIDIEGPIDAQFIITREQTVDVNNGVNTALDKINEAYNSIQNGMSVDDAVRKYSEDKNVSSTNGLLANYEPGRMFPEFDSIVYKMEKGAISKPFYSPYLRAWSIVYVKDKRMHPSFNEALEQIKRKVGRMPHSFVRSRNLALKLMKDYNVVAIDSAVEVAIDSLKEKYENGREFSGNIFEHTKSPIATINDTLPLIQHDFIQYVESALKTKPDDIVKFAKSHLNEFFEKAVLQYENKILPIKYPDFAYTVQEYHDGILLFNITDSIVWKKASADTAGLRQYFNKNREKYQWNERIDAAIITSNATKYKKKVEKALKAAIKKDVKIDEDFLGKLRSDLMDSTIFIRFERNLQEKGQNELVAKTKYKKGLHTVQNETDRVIWCYVYGSVSPAPKELDEVKGMVTADYQNELEKNWIKELRSKYQVVENKQILEKLYSK